MQRKGCRINPPRANAGFLHPAHLNIIPGISPWMRTWDGIIGQEHTKHKNARTQSRRRQRNIVFYTSSASATRVRCRFVRCVWAIWRTRSGHDIPRAGCMVRCPGGGGRYDAKMSPLRAPLAERSAMMFMLKVCGGLGNLCENLLFTWNTKWDYVYICTYENGKLYTSSYLACVKWLCGTLLLREWGVNMILGWHNSQVICQLVFVILTVFLIWLWSIYADSNEVRIRNYFLSTTNNVTCMSLVRSLYAILIFSKPSKCTINKLLNMHSDFQPAPPMFVTRRAVNFLPIYTYSNCPTPWNNRRHCAPCKIYTCRFAIRVICNFTSARDNKQHARIQSIVFRVLKKIHRALWVNVGCSRCRISFACYI